MKSLSIGELVSIIKAKKKTTLAKIYVGGKEVYSGKYREIPANLFSYEIEWMDSFDNVLVIEAHKIPQ